eukprot:gnl/TRDRNA2_/TRDRNA2_63061_c0_seq1.p1 gnl/TRDRNA2_/TRDRNA2_63061_c0~~gnl/TRDRNA2_/TRDRNA2_63061_c0_seq1.p1  ORF type:complete len:273 (+),score=31.94 gnl/TRDRNA2_/TRDRNA2_63061_c0_seq1:84-902(+)
MQRKATPGSIHASMLLLSFLAAASTSNHEVKASEGLLSDDSQEDADEYWEDETPPRTFWTGSRANLAEQSSIAATKSSFSTNPIQLSADKAHKGLHTACVCLDTWNIFRSFDIPTDEVLRKNLKLTNIRKESEHETAGWFTAKQRCAFHCPRDCQDRVNFKMTSDTGKILGIEHIVEPQVASHCMLVAGTAQSRCDCYCLDVAMTAEQVANNENVTSIADLVGYYASPEVCNVECSCMKDPPYMRRKVSVCLDEWRPYTTVDTNNKTNKTKR